MVLASLASFRGYVVASLALTTAVVSHAVYAKSFFYRAIVYLVQSKLAIFTVGNMAFATALLVWRAIQVMFLGPLRFREVERLHLRARDAIIESCFALTIFRDEFDVRFLGLVVTLLLLKSLHWLAKDRIEFFEEQPLSPMSAHGRLIGLLMLLFVVDFRMAVICALHTIKKNGRTMVVLFAFELAVLLIDLSSNFVRYLLHIVDLYKETRWDDKSLYSFYNELVCDLCQLSVYVTFFAYVYTFYTFPFHIIRDVYLTFSKFQKRCQDFLRYRRICATMNQLFEDATEEELAAGDRICIICREEMTTAKKLSCGHLFHARCLRSWLKRQLTCPTCRATIRIPSQDAAQNPPANGNPANPAQGQQQQPAAQARDNFLPAWAGFLNQGGPGRAGQAQQQQRGQDGQRPQQQHPHQQPQQPQQQQRPGQQQQPRRALAPNADFAHAWAALVRGLSNTARQRLPGGGDRPNVMPGGRPGMQPPYPMQPGAGPHYPPGAPPRGGHPAGAHTGMVQHVHNVRQIRPMHQMHGLPVRGRPPVHMYRHPHPHAPYPPHVPHAMHHPHSAHPPHLRHGPHAHHPFPPGALPGHPAGPDANEVPRFAVHDVHARRVPVDGQASRQQGQPQSPSSRSGAPSATTPPSGDNTPASGGAPAAGAGASVAAARPDAASGSSAPDQSTTGNASSAAGSSSGATASSGEGASRDSSSAASVFDGAGGAGGSAYGSAEPPPTPGSPGRRSTTSMAGTYPSRAPGGAIPVGFNPYTGAPVYVQRHSIRVQRGSPAAMRLDRLIAMQESVESVHSQVSALLPQMLSLREHLQEMVLAETAPGEATAEPEPSGAPSSAGPTSADSGPTSGDEAVESTSEADTPSASQSGSNSNAGEGATRSADTSNSEALPAGNQATAPEAQVAAGPAGGDPSASGSNESNSEAEQIRQRRLAYMERLSNGNRQPSNSPDAEDA